MDLDRDLLLKSFFDESAENLASMERAVLLLEKATGDRELVQSLFRDAHTVKGNALSLGFPAVAAFAHRLEDRLETVRNGAAPVTPELITLLLGSVDALRELLNDALAGEPRDRAHHRALMIQLEGKPAANPAPAAPEPVAPEHVETAATDPALGRTLRVGVEKLDRMLALSGEIAVLRGRVRRLLAGHDESDAIEELDRLARDLQDEILKVRAVPVGPTLASHARTVRDAAASHRKEVQLHVEGEMVEVDTAIVELLRDPLTHLVRNAVAHGIETPAQRAAKGKPACGTVSLRARHEGGCVVLSVSDDGAGFDREAILRTARSRGRAVDSETSDEELFKLVFEPGFSTATEVTDLSGRGVGLDVVRHNLEKLRGSVAVESKPGEGATITLRLPLTLAIIDAFFVGAGGDTYAIPLESMIECIDLPGDDGAAGGVLSFRGEALPWLGLSQHFGNAAGKGRRSLVVVQHGHGRAGIVVDRLDGEDQTVLKPLTGLASGARGVAGSALLGDGKIALILDVPALLDSAVEAARISNGMAGKVS